MARVDSKLADRNASMSWVLFFQIIILMFLGGSIIFTAIKTWKGRL